MSDPDESNVDVVRKATRELAHKFGYDYWRAKDKLAQYPWEFLTAFAEADGSARSSPRSTAASGWVSPSAA